ncbi:inner membrane CreD family protein [Roseibium aggregatum]|uniref:Uncharacterized protein n=1 Tax=Roseibium aggregatum TaxID=187304 RepID=A0A926S933_9HYPH|nr:inner membrane CreD family protein [Roseibium aggregatum]MBD1549787.1 hypothetical protein [Roseibium aggregatum]
MEGSWGGSQEINGPYLVVPFSETVTTMVDDKQKTATRWRRVVLFPEKLDATGDIKVEERKRSIYSLPVYKSRLDLKGRFAPPPAGAFEPREGGTIEIAADKAELVIAIGDIRAMKSDAAVTLDGARSVAFEPGMGELNVWPAPSARGNLKIALFSLRQRIRSRGRAPAKMEIRAVWSS